MNFSLVNFEPWSLEEVYLKDYESVTEARAGIERYFRFYNQERLHQSLQYRTPAAIYLARG